MAEPYAEGPPLREGQLGEWAELRRLVIEYDKLKISNTLLKEAALNVMPFLEGFTPNKELVAAREILRRELAR